MEPRQLKWWISLSLEPGVGAVTFRKLIERRSPEEVYSLSVLELSHRFPFLRENSLRSIREGPKWERVEGEWEKAHAAGIRIMTHEDLDYPELLKPLHSAPPTLYVKGVLPHEPLVGLVGTRRPSSYGKTAAEEFAGEFARSGYGIVSGMARGIDAVGHRACLKSGAPTVAVLGTGLDVPYPAVNRDLFETIFENGAVVSEFPFGTRPESKNFPRRNRIISGMSHGVLLIEAGRRSGALFTCAYALKQKRPLFAVPGSIFNPNSEGPNRLIQRGAALACAPGDIVAALKGRSQASPNLFASRSAARPVPQLDPQEQKVYDTLETRRSIEELCELCSSAPHRILPILLSLEVAGLVERMPGSFFHQKL